MADISDVRTSDLKEISDNLEALSCKSPPPPKVVLQPTNDLYSPNFGSRSLLRGFVIDIAMGKRNWLHSTGAGRRILG